MTRLRSAPALLPAAVVLGLLLWWAQHDGGYAPRDWLPGGLLLGALLVVTVVALGPALRTPSRAGLVAFGLFAAYTAWSFLSILWAEDPGRALQGSERGLIYLAAFTLALLLPWTARIAIPALWAWIGGITVLGVAALIDATTGDPSTSFDGARFADPLTYYNADAALWTMGALPAIVLAARRETPAAARPALLAASTFLLGLAFVTQSRGWALGLVITLGFALLVLPGRLRLLATFAAAVAPIAVVAGTLLDVYNRTGSLVEDAITPVLAVAIDDAAGALVLATFLAIVLGLVLTALDLRFPPTPRADTVARQGGRALAILAAVAALGAVAVVTDGDPGGWVDDKWTEFKGGEANVAPSSAGRFSSFGSTRYDLYRVSAEVWKDHPVAGAGQDNFLNEYLLLRNNDYEEARWTHSLPLRLLVHTGLVGLILFVAFLIAALVAALRARGMARVAAGAALLVPALWVAQGLIDWLWEYPVLTVATFVLLGIAVSLGSERTDAAAAEPASSPRAGARSVRVGACVIGALTVLLTVPAWIADRDVSLAAVQWTTDLDGAYDRLDRAHSLAPLDVRPPTVEGVIAARRGDLKRAQDAFARAAERDPHNWFPRFQLALIAAERGNRALARKSLEQAKDRNPREALVTEGLLRLRRGDPLTFQEVDERVRRNR